MKFGAGRPIEIDLSEEGGRACLTIRDHGIGIPLDQQDKVFGRFERAVSARHYGGLGLGLHISRRIVEAHGGSIQVVSSPGEGAVFTVELPCGVPANDDSGLIAAGGEQAAPPRRSNRE